jgi:hypothetical protein
MLAVIDYHHPIYYDIRYAFRILQGLNVCSFIFDSEWVKDCDVSRQPDLYLTSANAGKLIKSKTTARRTPKPPIDNFFFGTS